MAELSLVIIEDEEFLRKNLGDYFEDEGYKVHAFSRGAGALEYLESHSADVAIVDLRLPDMHGNQFILSAHKVHPEINFLIFTGSIDYLMPQDLIEIGLSHENVIFKPLFDMSILKRRIDKIRSHKLS